MSVSIDYSLDIIVHFNPVSSLNYISLTNKQQYHYVSWKPLFSLPVATAKTRNESQMKMIVMA